MQAILAVSVAADGPIERSCRSRPVHAGVIVARFHARLLPDPLIGSPHADGAQVRLRPRQVEGREMGGGSDRLDRADLHAPLRAVHLPVVGVRTADEPDCLSVSEERLHSLMQPPLVAFECAHSAHI